MEHGHLYFLLEHGHFSHFGGTRCIGVLDLGKIGVNRSPKILVKRSSKLFRCSIDAAQQQMALNFESFVRNQGLVKLHKNQMLQLLPIAMTLGT